MYLKKLLRKLNIHHTKNQIFIGFTVTMLLILLLTFGIYYYVLANVQKEKTKDYLQEIAKQMSGHIESLFNEVNTLTLQLVRNARVQEILAKELTEKYATYDHKIEIQQIMRDSIRYSDTIIDVEIYSNQQNIYPFIPKSIYERVGYEYIKKANEPFKIGSLLWIGLDPESSNDLIGIRQILLENRNYEKGGFLIVRINPSFARFIKKDMSGIEGSSVYIVDENEEIIYTTENHEDIPRSGKNYVTVGNVIENTDWTLNILIPNKVIMKEVKFLQVLSLLSFFASILLFGIMTYILSRIIASPIKRLTKVMQEGSAGDLKVNHATYYNYEINNLNSVYNDLVKRINYLIQSVYEKEIIKNQSEIRALHSQINPHFLFNTLDIIYWDLIQKDEDELSKVVIKLAQLFRYTIDQQSPDGFVTVKDEIDQICRYTDIMILRFPHRIEIELLIPEDLYAVRIPKLLLQPIVENAIKYGVEESNQTITIHVSAEKEKDIICFTITDNGHGMPQEKVDKIKEDINLDLNRKLTSKETGIGIYNIHKLIQLHYGKEYGIDLQSSFGEGTTVTITIPSGDEQ